MSNFYYGSQQQQHGHSNVQSSHPHHNGRSRRATRAAAHHNHNNHQHQKQMRALRLQQKEAEESALEKAWAFKKDFDAARSFEMEDDELFCPFNLLTDDDLQSMHSGSDRSSMSSGSPEHSPLQQQIQPTPAFLLPPSSGFSVPFSSTTQSTPQPKLHQPMAHRIGKAIPIVDPSTRTVASPPPSVSPARQLVQPPQFITVGGGSRRW